MPATKALALAGVCVAIAHCGQPRDPACKGLSEAECAWQQALQESRDAQSPDDPQYGGEGGADPELGELPPSEAVMAASAELMADGMGPAVVADRALDWCADPPSEDLDAQGARICALREDPQLGVPLSLEVRGDVITLSALGVSDVESEELVTRFRQRWRARCQADFVGLDADANHEFFRCPLAGGPILVVGRFPRDLEADLWQVSLAVMSAT